MTNEQEPVFGKIIISTSESIPRQLSEVEEATWRQSGELLEYERVEKTTVELTKSHVFGGEIGRSSLSGRGRGLTGSLQAEEITFVYEAPVEQASAAPSRGMPQEVGSLPGLIRYEIEDNLFAAAYAENAPPILRASYDDPVNTARNIERNFAKRLPPADKLELQAEKIKLVVTDPEAVVMPRQYGYVYNEFDDLVPLLDIKGEEPKNPTRIIETSADIQDITYASQVAQPQNRVDSISPADLPLHTDSTLQ